MEMKTSLWKRVGGIAVLVSFLVNSGAGATGGVPLQNNVSVNTQFVLSPDIGTIVNQYHGTGKDMVICIKDVHCNTQAQQHITRILRELKHAYGSNIRSVYREGAWGALGFDIVRAIPTSHGVRARVMEHLIQQGIFTGSEQFVVETRDMNMVGIEDRALYLKNRAAFLDALRVRRDALTVISLIEKQLKKEQLTINNSVASNYNVISNEPVGEVRNPGAGSAGSLVAGTHAMPYGEGLKQREFVSARVGAPRDDTGRRGMQNEEKRREMHNACAKESSEFLAR